MLLLLFFFTLFLSIFCINFCSVVVVVFIHSVYCCWSILNAFLFPITITMRLFIIRKLSYVAIRLLWFASRKFYTLDNLFQEFNLLITILWRGGNIERHSEREIERERNELANNNDCGDAVQRSRICDKLGLFCARKQFELVLLPLG